MKVVLLRKQIIRNFSIAAVLALFFGAIFFYYSNEKNGVKAKIEKISEETAQINNDLSDLQSKTAEINKYKNLWSKITANKKNTSGIKVDETNSKLSSIAAKYSIGSASIKLSLPELMKGGIFDRKTVGVMMSTATLTFVAANDVKALMFVDEFISSLKGYPVINSFSIERGKDYSNDDLIELSTGKTSGLINGKVDFFWYVYKDLEPKSAQSNEKKSAIKNSQDNSIQGSEVVDEQKQTP
jgi:hypothetical protein